MRTFAIKLLLGEGLIVALWFLQLPLEVDIALFVASLCVILRASASRLALTFFGLWLSIFGFYLLLGAVQTQFTRYYREHEKYAIPGGPYKPNVHEVIEQPHGDLVAIDPTLPRDLWEPRKVEFITDSRGYRNRADFSGEKHILFGDSFLVGNGVTQSDILPELLRTQFGIRNYAMAYPSNPADYERRAVSAIEFFGGDLAFSFFFYEGNDFGDEASSAVKVMNYAHKYDAVRLSLIRQVFASSTAPDIWYNIVRQASGRELCACFLFPRGHVYILRPYLRAQQESRIQRLRS